MGDLIDKCIIYINDILIMARSKQIALDHLYLTLNILEILGFLVNYPKCILQPTEIIDLGGFSESQRDKVPPTGKGDNNHQGGTTILNSPHHDSWQK